MEHTDPKAQAPKIRHRNIGLERRRLRNALESFTKAIQAEAEKQMRNGRALLIDPTPEILLSNRKDLVALIKEGMLERKDQEQLIAFKAMVVWFLRLEDDKRRQIMGEM